MAERRSIRVVKPGLATTVQDLGRVGYYHLGIPQSGAMDRYSFRAANLLVGNAEEAAALEIALLGPELHFSDAALVAVTGADLPAKVDGLPMPRYESFVVPAGSTLSFDYLKAGARAYLAVAGGIDVPVVLGSRSTYALGAFGGYQGRKLAVGDVVALGHSAAAPRPALTLPADLHTPLAREVQIRVMPGLYFHRLTDEASATFFADTWSVAPEADRIGYRYRHGRALKFKEREQPFGAGSDPSNIVDAGYPIGSIQVPGGLEPIILHRDAVSGGGYAMIGTVISADMDSIAQMQPNHKAHFVAVDMGKALAARASAQERLMRLRAALAR